MRRSPAAMPVNPSVVELAELSRAAYEESAEVCFAHPAPEPAASRIPPAPPVSRMSTASGLPGTAAPAFRLPVFQSSSAAPPAAGQCRTDGRPEQTTWRRSAAWRNRVGFYCAFFRRASDGAQVLAFRGTDDLWDGLVDDVAVAGGGVPPQVAAALTVARSAGVGPGVYLAGHSLGGALAIVVAAHTGAPAVTFNAPGVMDACIRSAPRGGVHRFFDVVGRCVSNDRILNIRIDGDPVSSFFTTGVQTGRTATPLGAPSCGLDPLCRHGIATCIASLREDRANFRPLAL